MRKEADDTGPLAELEYWKQRTAKFSCLVDQIKTQPCRGVITTLVAAKSKVIKVTNLISPTRQLSFEHVLVHCILSIHCQPILFNFSIH